MSTSVPHQWHLLPSSRDEALALGVRYFFPAEPCRRGHFAPRRVIASALRDGVSHCARCDMLVRRLIERTPPWLDEDALNTMADYYVRRPVGCHVDHIIPLNHQARMNKPIVVGLHTPSNLQHLPSRNNLTKGVQTPRALYDAKSAVQAGIAVWAKHVDRNGRVDWGRYGKLPESK